MPSSEQTPRVAPSVLIVGAGLGGLMLAILFERMGDVDYLIIERASTPKPLGSAMSFSPSVQCLFEQLGMLEELQNISLPFPTAKMMNEKMEAMGEVVYKDQETFTGYRNMLFPRPALYDLLLSKVPKSRIIWGKRVLKVDEDNEDKKDKVVVTCADNSEFFADLVTGADGVYSSVRQTMFRVMEEKGVLPKADKDPMKIGFVCAVGIAENMDPEKYPELKDDYAHFRSVIGGQRHNWGAINMRNNRFTWQLNLQYMNEKEAMRQQFMNSEWSPESNKEMLDEFRDFPNPFGGKMGVLIDHTPPELISKVFLEYKLFQTWHHGRSVLIGDACHKFLPAAGLGAVSAIQDAVILANCLYDVKDNSLPSLQAAFQSYYDQRFEMVKRLFRRSEIISKVLSGQTWTDRLLRWILMNLPASFQQRQFAKSSGYIPQVAFLPKVPQRGTIPHWPQLPSERYQQECWEQEAKKSNVDLDTAGRTGGAEAI